MVFLRKVFLLHTREAVKEVTLTKKRILIKFSFTHLLTPLSHEVILRTIWKSTREAKAIVRDRVSVTLVLTQNYTTPWTLNFA